MKQFKIRELLLLTSLIAVSVSHYALLRREDTRVGHEVFDQFDIYDQIAVDGAKCKIAGATQVFGRNSIIHVFKFKIAENEGKNLFGLLKQRLENLLSSKGCTLVGASTADEDYWFNIHYKCDGRLYRLDFMNVSDCENPVTAPDRLEELRILMLTVLLDG